MQPDRFSRALLSIAAGIALVGAPVSVAAGQGRQTSPPPPTAAATNDVAVTINYTGKGVVDATHSVVVFLFAEPNVVPTSRPIAGPQIVQKNGATVTFKDVATKPVYVFAVYNDKGGYDGRGGPPPVGTPVGQYARSATAPPTPVTPGAKTAVKLSFSDAKRWGQ